MIDVCCALIFHRGKLLAVQRHADSDHPNQWEFPGGKIESGETAVQCIQREILEELGVLVSPKGFLFPVTYDYGIKQIRLFPFVCSVENERVELREHQRLVWFNNPALKSINWQEADRLIIQQNGLEDLHRFWQDDEY